VSDLRKLAADCLGLSDVAGLEPQPLPDGSGWCVRVTWADGRVERVGTFGLESTARDWIEWEAPKFLRGRRAE
jgi:hypothetical protein